MQTKCKQLCFKVKKKETIALLNRCQEKSGAGTKAEVLRNALAKYEDFLDGKDLGAILKEMREIARRLETLEKSAP